MALVNWKAFKGGRKFKKGQPIINGMPKKFGNQPPIPNLGRIINQVNWEFGNPG